MSQIRKRYLLLILLLILVLLCKCTFNIKKKNYSIVYNGQKFKISETFNSGIYNVSIDSKDRKYLIKLYNKEYNSRKNISKIYFYQDDKYECLLPIISNNVEYNLMCYKDNILYDYNNIKGENKNLDSYVNSIKEYDVNKFISDDTKTNLIGTVKYFINNKIDNLSAITTYKGVIINGYNIDLFFKDIYNNKLSTFVDKYYIIADYTQSYEFQYFYVVDLYNKEVSKLKSRYEISLDSYIQGIVNNKIYIYDKDNENQYEIDIEKKSIKLISNDTEVKYYKNNNWEKISKIKANREVYFDYNTLENNFTEYDKVIESSNYYYLIKFNGTNNYLYRVDKENLNIYKYIGNIPTTNIKCADNYIYYVNNNVLYYYSDQTGLKAILEDSELQFNDTIKYYIK